MSEPPVLTAFLAAASANIDRGCHAVVAAVCARVAESWIALATSVTLLPFAETSGHVGTHIVNLPGFRALRGGVPHERVLTLLAGIHDGKLDANCLPEGWNDGHILLSRENRPLEFREPRLLESTSPENPTGHPAWIQSASQDSVQSVLDHRRWSDLQSRLPASDPPFSDLQELARHLGIQATLNHGSALMVTVASPYWVRLDGFQAHASQGTIDIAVLSAWPSLDDATVSFIPADPGRVDAKRLVPIVTDEWESEVVAPGWTRFKKSLELPLATGRSTITLNVGGIRIESLQAGLGGTRLVAHELRDPNYQHLRTRLQGGKKEKGSAEQFEEGVAWLLHLAGMSVVSYGAKDVHRGADVIAFVDEDRVLYGECTLTLPDSRKIAQLRAGAEAFRAALKGALISPPVVWRVLFCAEVKPANYEDALAEIYEQHRISIAFQDELQDLVATIQAGERAEIVAIRLATMSRRPFSRVFLD